MSDIQERQQNGGKSSQDGNVGEPYDETIIHKTILVGDSGVGKTSLLVQFDQGKFQVGSFSATVGIGFTNKVVEVDGTKVKLQIWDTAGQERFRSVTHAYYRDANALLLLYDVTNKSSFDNIRAWLTEINEYAQEDVVIMLLGNKSDMASERIIKTEDGEKLAKDHGVAFMETSAKTGMNVDLAFMAIARDLKMKKTRQPSDPKFNVAEYVDKEKKTPGCCS
ncbi:ras-related protein Rab-37-like isoform X2 [Mercenaria mercenaria]|uniref:ras-related protein Rab-37-like isoform X2 n=1 Tax=Mercenaria mercenaria TaxID=6596 RepID=UPI001E1DC818|nr:ras-related protein Rab-37-like isoform X2 [Mercenaria mercenaria]